MRMQSKIQTGLVNAALGALTLTMVVPLLLVLNVALKSDAEFLNHSLGLVESPQWDNFRQVWIQGEMGVYFQNSLIYAVLASLGACLISGLAAFPIARKHFRGSQVVYFVFLSALFFPVALVPLLYVMNALALINTYYGYVLLMIGNSLSISVFIFVAFVKGVPRELDEAAAIDGCGYFRYILTIVFPLMKPAIATVGMLVAIGTWNDFINPYLFLTDRNMRPLTSGLYLYFGQYATKWNYLSAGIIVVTAPLFAAYFFLQRYIVSGVTSGAIKG
ncbi:carbohydrate ABC transporter permease [Cohnella silvisoli]|uniref:Carbohydrate ABC transporter permease n=1 Tax=Cohnella silvisoli TaxID=2873699 RepID=A0ABV1KNC1_9BACL|nr:carbohydrate ABC transporter permease [Cohnella silvisoli]MCD9020372.1 carbohydrate ABC transporter permease [Cohnella silvisoli]